MYSNITAYGSKFNIKCKGYLQKAIIIILSENADNVDVVKTLKMFSLKDAVYFLDLAWQSISEKNIQKSHEQHRVGMMQI